MNTALQKITGSELARRLGCTKGLVSHWATGRKPVSAEWAVKIESVTDGLISRSELRPDLWPPTDRAA